MTNWLTLPKAAKYLQVGQTWLRQQILHAYNFPMGSPYRVNIHWRKVGDRYHVNVDKFPEAMVSHPPEWEKSIKSTINKTLEKEGVFVSDLGEKLTKAVMRKLI